MRTGTQTLAWFKRKDRPAAVSDSLGPYQFILDNPLEVIEPTISMSQLITQRSGDSNAWERCQEEGSINPEHLKSIARQDDTGKWCLTKAKFVRQNPLSLKRPLESDHADLL